MSILSRAIVLAALIASPIAGAMTLGPLVVHSDIGQPFQASIAVHGAAGPVQAHMAPRAAFRAAGIRPPGRGTVYHCRVTGQPGHQHIVVTSGGPVEHLDVTLLLVIDSTHGSRVQEYHAALRPVLMPTMHVQSGIEPTMMPSGGAGFGAPPGLPSPTLSRSPYRVIGPIRPGDSLLEAARAMDPGHHNLGPLMEALVRTNPNAFVDANANGLRVGAVLRRPDPSVVRAISSARALRFLRTQYTAWMQAHAAPAMAHRAVAIPVTPSAPLTPRPLATVPVTVHTAGRPDRAATAASGAATALSLAGVVQPPVRPIPESDGRPSFSSGFPTSAATLTGAGAIGHRAVAAVRPHPVPNVPVAPAAPAHIVYDGIPAHQLADLAILIIAVLGIRQFVRQRGTGSGFLQSPLARLFARPAHGNTQAPAAPAAAVTPPVPAAPAAPVSAEPARIPSYETSAAVPAAPEPQVSESQQPDNRPARPKPSAGSTLVVAVAHRDDQILRLDLARAYVDLGEIAVAREILTHVRAGLEAAHKPSLDKPTLDDHAHE